jgi:hypothetical protein
VFPTKPSLTFNINSLISSVLNYLPLGISEEAERCLAVAISGIPPVGTKIL